MSDLVRAPWTPQQVDNLNAWQARGNVHPYTCTGDHGDQRERTLLATEEGWICRTCGYTQDWAWEFSTRRAKVSGGYSDEEVEHLARHSRKFGYYGSTEHVWHLIDTVRSMRVRIAGFRGLAGERGAKIVRMDDQLRDVRRRVRTLLAEIDLLVDGDESEYTLGVRHAADDLRTFTRQSEGAEEDQHDQDDQYDDQ